MLQTTHTHRQVLFADALSAINFHIVAVCLFLSAHLVTQNLKWEAAKSPTVLLSGLSVTV